MKRVGGSVGLKDQFFTAKRDSSWTEMLMFYHEKGVILSKKVSALHKKG